jgi:hypothetical protein
MGPISGHLPTPLCFVESPKDPGFTSKKMASVESTDDEDGVDCTTGKEAIVTPGYVESFIPIEETTQPNKIVFALLEIVPLVVVVRSDSDVDVVNAF